MVGPMLLLDEFRALHRMPVRVRHYMHVTGHPRILLWCMSQTRPCGVA